MTDDAGVTGPSVANLGWVRPPFVYLIAIVLGLVGHALWPKHLVQQTFGVIVGAVLLLSALVLFLSAIRTFETAGTPVPGNQPTTRIVQVGPYRFTRNPIYLAFTLLQLGVALLINSVALLITLLPAFGLMTFLVVPREERYLEARFGREYSAYKARVRRWF